MDYDFGIVGLDTEDITGLPVRGSKELAGAWFALLAISCFGRAPGY